MPLRKGVAVHDDGTCGTSVGSGQGSEKLLYAAASVFHEQYAVRLRHGIEKQGREHVAVLRLGVEEEMVHSCLKGILPQKGQHRGGEPLALVGIADCNALEDISLPGACCDDLFVLPYEDSFFHALVGVQLCRFQKCRPFVVKPSGGLGNDFSVHGAPPPDSVLIILQNCIFAKNRKVIET